MTGSPPDGRTPMSTEPTPEPAASSLPAGTVEGREAFRQCVRAALRSACMEGWTPLMACDPDFADWPLGERDVVELLHDWSRRGYRWVMLAGRYDLVERQHPLFADWRRRWADRIECRVVTTHEAANMPSLLWSPHWSMQRVQRARCRAVCGPESSRGAELRELYEAFDARSTPGFPVTTLGL